MNSFSSVLLCLSFLLVKQVTAITTKPYIVYLGGHAYDVEYGVLTNDEHVEEFHCTFLGTFLGDEEKARDAIFYSYTKHINGFAANLEEKDALEISKHPSVVSIFRSELRQPLTTRSWSFLGLERDGRIPTESIWSNARLGEDTIIANLDTGVWPESQSFREDDMGDIPSRWKGFCENEYDTSFKCNRKLIGARYFNKGYNSHTEKSAKNSPRDDDSHGTHTLSTAGGAVVPGANINGCANGTAKGGSPAARVAAYKVCWANVCTDADILAGFDAAIHDGVDVISFSVGGPVKDYFTDGASIGSFHAMRKGITVVLSAGNGGPTPGSLNNVAPWMFTVAASTIDRSFPAYLYFGSKRIQGESLSQKHLQSGQCYLMINGKEAKASNATQSNAEACLDNSLDSEKVRGKIVVCLRGNNEMMHMGNEVLRAGGVGVILVNDFSNGNDLIAEPHTLPATHISYEDGRTLYSYLNSTKSPLGFITPPTTMLGKKPAPSMASFSSMGPNQLNPEIIKPDIAAPGVNILAAVIPPQKYDLDSGTSMAAPHISGVVGLLKTLHPNWSPAAIKSAIMTTARVRDNTGKAIIDYTKVKATPFSYGSGHVRPNSAMDPGLVYDLTTEDYLKFLCSIGYDSIKMASFNLSYTCPLEPVKVEDLNYPSFAVPNLNETITVHRKLKNVGSPGTYKVRVRAPAGISVSIKPSSLKFTHLFEEKLFAVTLKPIKASRDYMFGGLIWSDGKHNVRSPIAVKVTENSN